MNVIVTGIRSENKISNLQNLIGTLFRGEFYKNPEEVAKELKALEEHSEQFPETEAEAIRKNAEHFIFDLRIHSHNPDSRLFVATANDFFGDSGIVGVISDEEICFEKIYARDALEIFSGRPNSVWDFRRIRYWGQITQSGKTMKAKGEYKSGGFGTAGFWEMYSVGG